MDRKQLVYKPLQFIAIAFLVSWAGSFFMAYQTWFSYDSLSGRAVLGFADFLESASPLLATLILWRTPLFSERRLFRFVLGNKPRILPYSIVVFLFAFQFFTFYLFGTPNGTLSFTTFLTAWGGQILFGGGMEEGGWRGYLQPFFEKKLHITVSVIIVALIWALWHVPLFFLPDSFLEGSNFLMYMITITATAFTLTAIYKLTGSVLLCTLFHGWQNAIVMNIPPNMSHPGFITMFVLQTVVSVFLCIKPLGAVSAENLMNNKNPS